MSGVRYNNIQGFFGYGKFYEEVIENAVNGDTILELGSYMGRSTAYLLELANKSGKNLNIIAVDHFQGSVEHQKIDYYSIFKSNMDQLEFPYKYSVLKMDSCEAASQFDDYSLDVIMIDASHDYDNVKKDIQAWLPKLKSTGVFAGDDYDWPGVSKAVNELIKDYTVFPRTGGDCCHDIYAGNYWVKYGNT